MNMIPEKISTRFRIGIIGPGSICVTYGNALKASDTVSLACICGRDTEKGRKTAERFQVPYYTDQEQMYRNEALDGVLICTPTYTHEEMVRRALARRVPVMCEKPLALDAETARRLVAEAADADVPFMAVSYTHLDVYKRQSQDPAGKPCAVRCSGSFGPGKEIGRAHV